MFYKHYIWARNQIHEANTFTVDPYIIGRQFNRSNRLYQSKIFERLRKEAASRYAAGGFKLGSLNRLG